MKRKIRKFRRKILRLPTIQRVILTFSCILCVFFTALVITVYAAPKFQAKVEYIPTQNGMIAYYVRGRGEPLVLIPGFGMTMQHWDPTLIESLSQNYQVIVFDYRGVGDSSGSLKNLSEADMAQDVITIMDGLQLDKAHVVGWSLGSFVAQNLAENHANRVDKLVLISTTPGGNQSIAAPDAIKDAVNNNIEGSWEDVFAPMMFLNQNKEEAYLARLKAAQTSKEVPKGREESMDAKNAHQMAFADPELEEARYRNLPNIKSQTLIIGGDKDQFTPIANAKKVQEKIPGSKLYIVKGGGHAAIFENGELIRKEINTFLGSR